MKNWKKTGIAALCVAALLAGCGTQGGKDDKEDDTIGADTPMPILRYPQQYLSRFPF